MSLFASSKPFVLLMSSMFVACSSSSEPPPAQIDSCLSMQQQCDSCVQREQKESCLTAVTSAKSAGETGQRTCKAAVESQAYAGKDCQPCKFVKTQCDLCTNPDLKRECNEVVAAGKGEECARTLDSERYRKLCGACGTLLGRCERCTDDDVRSKCSGAAVNFDEETCKSMLADADVQSKCK